MLVETLAIRHELREMSEVPLADERGRVPARLQHLGEGHFVERQARRRGVHEDAGSALGAGVEWLVAIDAGANRQTARQERGATGRAHRRSRIEVRPALALGAHPVEMWRSDIRVPVTREIAVAEIVSQDHDDVQGGVTLGTSRSRGGDHERGGSEDDHAQPATGGANERPPEWRDDREEPRYQL